MRVRLVLFLVSLLLVLTVSIGCASWSPRASVHTSPGLDDIPLQGRMRTWEEHDEIVRAVGNPYIVEIESSEGSLVFYGARHTSDPADPQMADIEQRWEKLSPTVALCEGRRRGYFVGPLGKRISEAALVHELARRDGVRLLSLEPDYETEVRLLLRKWTPEQVALYFTMRVYWSEAGGKANDKLAKQLLSKRTDVAGLEGSLESVGDIDRVWNRDFPTLGDWRTLNTEPKGTYLAEISDDSRRVRGEHMARTLIDLTRKGERVFAVVGSGHVIRLEWILEEGLS